MRLSLQRRLLFAFLGLAIVPLLLAAATNAVFYYRQQADAELKHLHELALRVAIEVDDGLRQGERALDGLLLARDPAHLSASDQQMLLAELLARHNYLQEASIIDASGHERAHHSTVEAVFETRRDRHTDESFTLPFTNGNIYHGPLHYNASGEPLITIAVPLRDLGTGKVDAVLSAELNLKSLRDRIAALAPGPGVEVYVLDEHGTVVASRDPSIVLRETIVRLRPGPHVGQGLFGRAFIADSEVWLGPRLFRVVAEHQWSHAMGPAVGNLIALAGVLLCALAVALGAGAHVMRRVVQPVVSLERTAQALAAGDLTRRVPVKSDDEIGDLANSFNTMAENLQRTLGALRSEVLTRERAEHSLRSSEAYLQRLLHHLPAAVVVHGPDSAIRYGNPAALRFLGLTIDQLLGKSTFDPAWHFVSEDGSPMPLADFPANRVIADHRRLTNYLVGVVPMAGEAPRWGLVDAFPDLDEQGNLRQVIVSFVDITERKLAETELRDHREQLETLVAERTAALRESETRYRTVANFTNDWETWRSEDNVYLYVSPSCERITGYRAEEFLADSGLLLRLVHPDDRDAYAAHLTHDRVTGHNERVEFRLQRRDGVVIWIEHICQPVYEGEHYLGIRASNRDVTERKRQAIELAKARDDAQAANRAKSIFLANMSHELRTPMNAILGFAQLLRNDPSIGEEQRSKIETISRSGHHLLTLINDVLEISKIEAGKVGLDAHNFDLMELCNSLEEVVRLRAEKKRLALAVELAPDLPRYCKGDEKKLRQILLNLLGNAVKFTEHGGLRLKVERDAEAEGRLKFQVFDTGCGIDAAEQQRIFDAFYQTPDSVRRGEGTGLGLTISREYVTLLGGRLEVESEPGKGSCFHFVIPLEAVSAAQVEPRRPGRRVISLAPGQPPCRILIAEDRPDSRVLLQQLLEAAGFEVRAAENGEQALNLFHTWHPHLIWMDMRMPVMDGYEATRLIKASPEGRATVILALTASAFEEDRAEVLATGCDGFLRKPLDVDEVFTAMTRHLGVQYRYADESVPPTAPEGSRMQISPAALASIPQAQRDAIANAALRLDPRQAHAAIADIADPEISAALGRMVDDYRFDELLKLCQEPGGK